MIRREDLTKPVPVAKNFAGTYADLAAAQAKRGESVRVVGLGTLIDTDPRNFVSVGPYRLTLTAGVAKLVRDGHLFDRDVRHLARALGAPVEVWAPPSGKGGAYESDYRTTRITTINPEPSK